MAVLYGDLSRLKEEISIKKIPDVPGFSVASIDGYGNIKTTIRKSHLSSSVMSNNFVRVGINNIYKSALNTAGRGIKGKIGDLCMVKGSSGGKGRNYIEIIKLQGRAADEFGIYGPRDDLGKIEVTSDKKEY